MQLYSEMWLIFAIWEATWNYNQEQGDVKECDYLHHGVLLDVSVISASKTLYGGTREQECKAEQRPEVHGAWVLEVKHTKRTSS